MDHAALTLTSHGWEASRQGRLSRRLAMRVTAVRLSLAGLVFMFALAACGDGGSDPPASRVNTLAYAVTACQENAHGITGTQSLKVRQRNGETITIADLPPFGPIPALGLCRAFGLSLNGPASVVALPVQRLGVSPDGSTVAFEVTDDHSIVAAFLPAETLLAPEEEGFFAVNADGTNLRRLGPASREPNFRFVLEPSAPPLGIQTRIAPLLSFRPDGNRVVFTDLGTAPDGQEAVQVFTLDLADGARTQITHLPRLTPPAPYVPAVSNPGFIDADRIVFFVDSVEQPNVVVITRADGSGEISREQTPIARGGTFVPRFVITERASVAPSFILPEEPINPLPGLGFPNVSEIFLVAGDNRLQLTRFRRSDTGLGGSIVNRDSTRVLFTASVDPFDRNADESCEFFSIGVLGTDLRQVTEFTNGEHHDFGCGYSGGGCNVFVVGQDLAADTVEFGSTCNPFTGNSASADLFAMRLDGSDILQLTSTRGITTAPDRSVDVELPGPYAYPETYAR